MFDNFEFDFDFDAIKWWIEDHLKEIVSIGVVFFIVFGGVKVVQMYEDDGSPEGVEESLVFLIETSQQLKNTFSLLEEREIGVDDNYPVVEVSLYVKEPFITSVFLEQALLDYTEALKLTYKTKGQDVKAIRYILYDRKILWEKGLKAKGVYEYRLPTSVVSAEDVNTTTFGTETQTYDEVAWDLTINEKGKPKYVNYELEGRYQYLKRKQGVDMLSDQEFEWFLKYDLYQALGNGFNLYLTWDLGAQPREEGRTTIKRQFDEFVDRLGSINDYTSYYDYPDGLKRELVIDKPQFLYYTETGEVAKDDEDARRKLLEFKPSLYTSPIDKWLDQLANQQVSQINNPQESTYDEPLVESLEEPLLDGPINNEANQEESLVEYEPITEESTDYGAVLDPAG